MMRRRTYAPYTNATSERIGKRMRGMMSYVEQRRYEILADLYEYTPIGTLWQFDAHAFRLLLTLPFFLELIALEMARDGKFASAFLSTCKLVNNGNKRPPPFKHSLRFIGFTNARQHDHARIVKKHTLAKLVNINMRTQHIWDAFAVEADAHYLVGERGYNIEGRMLAFPVVLKGDRCTVYLPVINSASAYTQGYTQKVYILSVTYAKYLACGVDENCDTAWTASIKLIKADSFHTRGAIASFHLLKGTDDQLDVFTQGQLFWQNTAPHLTVD